MVIRLCTLITIISEVLAIVYPTAAQTSGSSFCVNIFVLLSLVLTNFTKFVVAIFIVQKRIIFFLKVLLSAIFFLNLY